MNKLNLSDNIIRLRHEKKLTQEELADFMGVTKGSVSKWEKGINTPDILLLPRLAAFFDVTVDELIGYEAQLSGEQIRYQYGQLSGDFAALPFREALEKTRSLAHRYYACYPLLLQLSVLYWNHYMLAETKEEQSRILQEAAGWCDRIMENSGDVGLCSDALVLKAGLNLQLGKAVEAVEALEPSADPGRLAGQNGTLLVQAYQMSGEHEKARSYAQAKYYLDLVNLTGDAVLSLSLNEHNLEQCEETIRRVKGILELYHLEELTPNLAAQFHYQSAVVFGMNGEDKETLEALRLFETCVNRLLQAERIELHGDDYFDLLDAWIDQQPLGNMAPRDKSFIKKSLGEALAHPAFGRIKDKDEFHYLLRRLTEGGETNA